jgi:hypothetical protein
MGDAPRVTGQKSGHETLERGTAKPQTEMLDSLHDDRDFDAFATHLGLRTMTA